ncbi:MAG: rRNA small subunit methyltransferase [Dehalococcoidia bacterium]|nr:rRNA small subunit methyltransferase [Dehalococcoidia bacterium]
MVSMTQPALHISVLLHELIEGLAVISGGRYIDCTLGGGGHAKAVLSASMPGGRLLGMDADPRAVETAGEALSPFYGHYTIVNENFGNLEVVAHQHGFSQVQGIYFDLGLSSLQLDEPGRGFSFLHDDPLDMRFGPWQTRTAAELVNDATVEELARVIHAYGEEPRSWAIARRVAAARPVTSTKQLADLIREAAPVRTRHIHPATRTFQALRIWVNDELAVLEKALEQAVGLLAPGGRIAVIAFHSLEDRIVKDFFASESRDCICPPRLPVCVCGHKAVLKRITRRVIVPTQSEQGTNPRSRSARLRVAERV